MNPLISLLLNRAAEEAGPRMARSQNSFIAGLGRGINRINEWDNRIDAWGNRQLENLGSGILSLFSRGEPNPGDYSRDIATMAQRYLDSAGGVPLDASQRIGAGVQDRLDEDVDWTIDSEASRQAREANRPGGGQPINPSRGIGNRGGEVIARRTGDARNDRALESMAEGLLGRSVGQQMRSSAQQARNAMQNMFRGSER